LATDETLQLVRQSFRSEKLPAGSEEAMTTGGSGMGGRVQIDETRRVVNLCLRAVVLTGALDRAKPIEDFCHETLLIPREKLPLALQRGGARGNTLLLSHLADIWSCLDWYVALETCRNGGDAFPQLPDSFKRELSDGIGTRPVVAMVDEKQAIGREEKKSDGPAGRVSAQIREDTERIRNELIVHARTQGAAIMRPLLQRMREEMLRRLPPLRTGGDDLQHSLSPPIRDMAMAFLEDDKGLDSMLFLPDTAAHVRMPAVVRVWTILADAVR